ncbi:hypothetical protein JHK82_054136 [Glycine max]|nr:hypothetical protein JHK84_054008 [Glycine max]KAG5086739.1 hypothetical protein JHK82_054136 [Glycine max]
MDSIEVNNFTMQSHTYRAKARRAHHVAQWLISSLAWSMRRDKSPRFAIGSYLEHYTNKVELVHHFNHDTFNFTSDPRLVLNHPYEVTRILTSSAESLRWKPQRHNYKEAYDISWGGFDDVFASA